MTRSFATRLPAMALAATLATLSAASAQTYPNGQVRLIVPTSPGGVTDTMARIVAQRLTESLAWTATRTRSMRRVFGGRLHLDSTPSPRRCPIGQGTTAQRRGHRPGSGPRVAGDRDPPCHGLAVPVQAAQA